MANIKSAEKRARTSEKARRRNAEAKSRLKTLRRNLLEHIASKDPAKAETAYRTYCSALDKAVKRGIIKKNNSIRKKNRAALLLRQLSAT